MHLAGKGKKKSSRLPKATGLFYQKFSQSKIPMQETVHELGHLE
jgi:hypothetical protein